MSLVMSKWEKPLQAFEKLARMNPTFIVSVHDLPDITAARFVADPKSASSIAVPRPATTRNHDALAPRKRAPDT